jgi:hypothetical protein
MPNWYLDMLSSKYLWDWMVDMAKSQL